MVVQMAENPPSTSFFLKRVNYFEKIEKTTYDTDMNGTI